MPKIDSRRPRISMPALAAAALLLGGCSQGDVEVNGAIFDYLGVSSKSGATTEAKVPPRPGLVVPPNTERLPQPGSGAIETAAIEGMPVDPEQKKLQGAALAERQHEEKCKELLWKAKVAGTLDRTVVRGPLGICNQSILNNVQSNTGLDTTKQGVDPTAKFAKPIQ